MTTSCVAEVIRPTKSFTTIPNSLIRDSTLSAGAFRLVCWMASHTADYRFTISSVATQLGVSRPGVRGWMRELGDRGILSSEPIPGGNPRRPQYAYRLDLDSVATEFPLDGPASDSVATEFPQNLDSVATEFPPKKTISLEDQGKTGQPVEQLAEDDPIPPMFQDLEPDVVSASVAAAPSASPGQKMTRDEARAIARARLTSLGRRSP